jgi:type III pantothenate kinase
MNLVIDLGNTSAKTAVFNDGKMLEVRRDKELSTDLLKGLLGKYPGVIRGIVSSVAGQTSTINTYLGEVLEFLLYADQSTPLPIGNLYESPSTLGFDRIAAAVGAYTIFPGRNVLVIDAGTAITIDMVTEKGNFFGGNISPGALTRVRALNQFTRHLPVVEIENEYPLLGRKTDDAIRAGVMNGIVFEIEGYIERLGREYHDLQIILTGGDANYFDKKLKYSIFVDSNLNLTGLNRILDYNAE